MNNGFLIGAIILKRKNMGEADRLLTLLTREMGKITVLAKGVRRAVAKRKSHIELFNTIRCQLIEGKSFWILAQTELVEDRSIIKSNLKLLRIAYHLVELAERLLPENQKQGALFELLNRALSSINMNQWKDEDRLTSAFEEKLLRLLGFGTPEDKRQMESYIESLMERKLRSREILR